MLSARLQGGRDEGIYKSKYMSTFDGSDTKGGMDGRKDRVTKLGEYLSFCLYFFFTLTPSLLMEKIKNLATI